MMELGKLKAAVEVDEQIRNSGSVKKFVERFQPIGDFVLLQVRKQEIAGPVEPSSAVAEVKSVGPLVGSNEEFVEAGCDYKPGDLVSVILEGQPIQFSVGNEKFALAHAFQICGRMKPE